MDERRRRLMLEKEQMDREPPCGCGAVQITEDLSHWKCSIPGPPDTPYAGGIFVLDVRFPPNYPCDPPRVVFETPIFHPNIDRTGAICLPLLTHDWRPSSTVATVLLSIMTLLTEPNPDSYLSQEAAHLLVTDRRKYEQVAREWTATHAIKH